MLPNLPHALLIHGPRGVGKYEFAQDVAGLLLCPDSNKNSPCPEACGKCSPCLLYKLGNHPDFFLIQPEADAVDAAEGDESTESAPAPDKRKNPSKQIRIEQVRDLLQTIQTGTHQGGRRVVLITPAESMNAATANALLKTLEEPPPDTILLLLSSEPDRLLPTLRSRCQSIALAEPDHGLALDWLKSERVADAEAQLALAGGAPLLARARANDEGALDHRLVIERLALARDPFGSADAMAKSDPVTSVDWLQRWVCDLLMLRLGGTIRYHPDFAAELQAIARDAPVLPMLRLARRLTELRAIASHPVNPRLFFERLALDYLDGVGADR